VPDAELRARIYERHSREEIGLLVDGCRGLREGDPGSHLGFVVLAAIGVYSVTSFSIAQRTREIGVRMALGARSDDVLAMVLKQGMRLVSVGVVLGLLLAFGAARSLESFLYGVSGTDTVTFAAVPLVLAAVAFVACLVPARRAMKLDPLVALRWR